MLDLAIIGGGPAGLTAGLYATRGGLKNVTMFEKGLPGGQITQSSEIENYPGQLEVVTGMELMDKWPQQCKKFGLKHDMNEVKQITKKNDIFSIILGAFTPQNIDVCPVPLCGNPSTPIFASTGKRYLFSVENSCSPRCGVPANILFKNLNCFFINGFILCLMLGLFLYVSIPINV